MKPKNCDYPNCGCRNDGPTGAFRCRAPLDAVADKVLAYRAPARTKKAKKRQRVRRKAQRESCI